MQSKDNMKLSRKGTRLLQYLKDFGAITSLEAFQDLGDSRLSATIFDLKKAGVVIFSTWIEVRNRYGEVVRFKQYHL